MNGERVNDAVHARNAAVEDHLGIQLEVRYETGAWSARNTYNAIITNSIKGASEQVNMLGVNKYYYERLLGDLDKVAFSANDPRRLAKEIIDSGKELPDLYFACGYNDSLSNPNRDLHRYLDSIGFKHVYEEGPGSHEWPFWRKFLARGLEHALGKVGGEFINPFFLDNYDPEFDVIGKEEK